MIVVLLAVALFTLRNFGRRISSRLPLPHRIVEFYDRFEQGVFGALERKQLPALRAPERRDLDDRVACACSSSSRRSGFPDVELGISGAVFVALIGSLLTAVPLSPAGLGIVEAGIVGILTLVYGVPLPEATAIALAGPRDQRVLGDRVRVDPVRGLGQAARRGPDAIPRVAPSRLTLAQRLVPRTLGGARCPPDARRSAADGARTRRESSPVTAARPTVRAGTLSGVPERTTAVPVPSTRLDDAAPPTTAPTAAGGCVSAPPSGTNG